MHHQLQIICVEQPHVPRRRVGIHHHRGPVEVDRVEPDPSQVIKPRTDRFPLLRLHPLPEPIPHGLRSHNQVRTVGLNRCRSHRRVHERQVERPARRVQVSFDRRSFDRGIPCDPAIFGDVGPVINGSNQPDNRFGIVPRSIQVQIRAHDLRQ